MEMIAQIDVERARRETPGCNNVLHFNNAGAALMPKPVLETMLSYLDLETRIGGYEAVDASEAAIRHSYSACAALVNARQEEIAIMPSATRAWDMVFYAIPLKPGDRILTSMAEYASNYIAYLHRAQKTGAIIDVIPDDEFGQVSIRALENLMDDSVRLVSITHIPTNGGLVNPAKEIGQVVRQSKAYYLLDACQSAGQFKIDVREIGCHFLSTTSRKYLRGPRGAGFLYISHDKIEALDPPFLDIYSASWTGRDQYEVSKDANRFEDWEANYVAKVGLGAAIDYLNTWDISAVWSRITCLAETLRQELSKIPGVTVRDIGQTRCGIVTFNVGDKDPVEMMKTLRTQGINISTSSVFSTRLDMERRHLTGMARASVHYYNTTEEIERFCQAIRRL